MPGVRRTRNFSYNTGPGEMAERPKAPVSKTGMGATSSWVRIPLSPPPQARNRSPEAAGVLPSSLPLHPHQEIPVLAVLGPSDGQALTDQNLIDAEAVLGVNIGQEPAAPAALWDTGPRPSGQGRGGLSGRTRIIIGPNLGAGQLF